MTAKQIIEGALRTIGVLANGEEGQPSELQDGLEALNGLLASWNNDSLLIPNLTQKIFTLGDKATYTYGIGGDFDDVRPINVEFAQFLDVAGYYYTCELYGMRQYAVSVRPVTIRPTGMYFEASYPLAQIHFPTSPFPSDKLVLQVLEPLSYVADIHDDLIIPDGYERTLKLNLAVELAAEFAGTLRPETVQLAEDAKRQLKIKNTRVNTLTFDFNTTRGVYNIVQGPVK